MPANVFPAVIFGMSSQKRERGAAALDQLAVATRSFGKLLSAPREMQEILTVLRTMVDVQQVFSHAAQSALLPASVDAQLGRQGSVTVNGENVPARASLTAHLKFDPRLVRIPNIVPAGMARQNGSEPKVTGNIAFAMAPDGNTMSGSEVSAQPLTITIR
jgi:hypothetical protein